MSIMGILRPCLVQLNELKYQNRIAFEQWSMVNPRIRMYIKLVQKQRNPYLENLHKVIILREMKRISVRVMYVCNDVTKNEAKQQKFREGIIISQEN